MANSQITRRAIAAALKQLLESTPFDRVTVTALASLCGINRQTFYYHFRDIYDLIGWIVEDRMRTLLDDKNVSIPKDAEVIIAACLTALKEERELVTRLLRSTDPVIINLILQNHLGKIIENSLDAIYEQSHVTEDDRRIVSSFCVGGFLNTVYVWIDKGMREDPRVLAQRLATIICTGLSSVIPLLS
ncbi:MAG: TetR/AcrR family transcriptional regulator C-terminal domain-containing protein [Atopobiaceae bacterium]|nr:TetR/AcrR family transcriptional regulator C-terminal domain-containing protein [Atopobiaceae bacterium]